MSPMVYIFVPPAGKLTGVLQAEELRRVLAPHGRPTASLGGQREKPLHTSGQVTKDPHGGQWTGEAVSSVPKVPPRGKDPQRRAHPNPLKSQTGTL